MNEKLILELLRDRRITVEETLALLGHQNTPPQTFIPEPRLPRPQQRRRRAKIQNVISVERHYEIIRSVQEIGCRQTAKRMGYPPETVRNHARYAGLIPTTPASVAEVQNWRRRRGLYLDKPIEIKEGNNA